MRVPLLFAAALGCSNPGGAASDASAGDGSAPSFADSLLGDAPPHDALALDASPDSAPPCAQLGGTVRVYTAYVSNLLIHDADGQLVQRTTSAAGAGVDVTVPACGSVTSAQSDLYYATVTDLAAGDTVWVDGYPGIGPPQGPAYLDVENEVAGALYYRVLGPVIGQQTSTPGRLSLHWKPYDVDTQGRLSIAVHPVDPVTGSWRRDRYALFDDVAPIALIQQPLRVTSWETETVTRNVQLTFPTPVTDPSISAAPWMDVHGMGAEPVQSLGTQTHHTASIVMPTYGDATGIQVVWYTSDNQTHLHTAVVPLAPTTDLDLSTSVLPIVTSASAVPALRPEMSWTLSGPTPADLVLLRLRTPSHFSWEIAVHPDRRSYRVPALPADLQVDFAGPLRVGVQQFETSELDGFDEARCHPQFGITAPRMPLGATLRMTRNLDF